MDLKRPLCKFGIVELKCCYIDLHLNKKTEKRKGRKKEGKKQRIGRKGEEKEEKGGRKKKKREGWTEGEIKTKNKKSVKL